VLNRGAHLPVGLMVLAALLCCTPGQAQAAGVAGLSTTIGLASALLVLLAIQSSAGALPPVETLGASAATLIGLAAFAQWWRGGALAAWRARRSATQSQSCHAGLLALARAQFVQLQAAWDRGDVAALGALTTAEMLDELLSQLPARGPGPNRTDVLSLEARVLAVEQLGPLELASIEFSGIVCESADRGPVPFREVWMLARSGADAGTWRLARQQALL
jgi:predicted lipid-binding transport protein (Tim44 family)